ncbi:hypothetical protein BDW67DRAFT_177102 [Aspergillus spinulosporus]
MDRLNLPCPQSLHQHIEVGVGHDHISSLSPDLLLHVFGYLREDGRSLCNYVPLSVVRFKHFVESYNNVRRRSMVRKLVFHHQATQFPIGPGETASRAQDPAQNLIDAGFRKAVAGLFQVLRFWESWYKIELVIVLTYSYTGASRLASMANPSTALTCEHGQLFQRIWEATPFHIAQSCANLASLGLDSDAFRLTGRQAPVLRRRNNKVIAECLGGLPTATENFSMRVTGVSNPYVLDWFTPEEDPFSCKLLRINTYLHAIKLYNVTLPADFWCPLDENYRPKRDLPVWPCLTHIFSDDNCLVEGTGKQALVRLI